MKNQVFVFGITFVEQWGLSELFPVKTGTIKQMFFIKLKNISPDHKRKTPQFLVRFSGS